MFFNLNENLIIFLFEIENSIIKTRFHFLLDYYSSFFFSILSIIVGSVYIFASLYIKSDLYKARFLNILKLFVLSMIILIFVPHSVFLFVGYDGLGVVSFLLVVYYRRSSSWVSGLKTFLIKRAGDGFFLFGLIFILKRGIRKIFELENFSFLVGFILVLGWFTKRAQYPFSRWLPAAMAAPTPVSALVHSSTLVTAGVYLLFRFQIVLSPNLGNLVMVLGLLTLFISRLRALVEWDSKKVVAFSTLRQLGLMVYSLGIGLYDLCFFHLIKHAVFKALMFIVVGYFILNRNHLQDLRLLNRVFRFNRTLLIVLWFRVCSLRGFPFLIAFYSKDLIVESFFLINILSLILFTMRLVFTRYYGFRLLYYLRIKKTEKELFGKVTNWKYSLRSVIFLLRLILTLGNRISWDKINISFVPLWFKALVFTLILLGFLIIRGNLNLKKKFFLWLFKNINFLKTIKTYFFTKKFSSLGSYYNLVLDNGIWSIVNQNFKIVNPSINIRNHVYYFKKINVFYWALVGFGLIVFFFIM